MTANRILQFRTTPTSLKGEEAARRKLDREVSLKAEADQRERELRAIIERQQMEARESEMEAGVRLTAVDFARRAALSDLETKTFTAIVENARLTHRPSAEQRVFDVYSAIDVALAHVRPKGEHISRSQAALTREQRIKENETYTETLKRLGLQNPAFPSIPSGIST